MGWEYGIYYSGYVLAILLCRKLGWVFFVPMLVNMGFNLCLNTGLLSGWDIRWIIAGHGCAVFVWVLMLSGALGKPTVGILVAADMAVVVNGIWEPLRMVGTGGDFWIATSTSIIDAWMVSIATVVGSIVMKSTIMARFRGERVDLLTNPKKRFLLPIGAWAAIIAAVGYLGNVLPAAVVDNRFNIAGYALVWGWVALEFPFYLMYQRLRKQFG